MLCVFLCSHVPLQSCCVYSSAVMLCVFLCTHAVCVPLQSCCVYSSALMLCVFLCSHAVCVPLQSCCVYSSAVMLCAFLCSHVVCIPLQSCCERVKELTGQLQQMLVEAEDLDLKIRESCRGFKEQVSTILSMPPPRVLYQGQLRSGTEVVGGQSLPPGRSTLQAPQRGGRGHERRASGDKRSRGGFTSTL